MHLSSNFKHCVFSKARSFSVFVLDVHVGCRIAMSQAMTGKTHICVFIYIFIYIYINSDTNLTLNIYYFHKRILYIAVNFKYSQASETYYLVNFVNFRTFTKKYSQLKTFTLNIL